MTVALAVTLGGCTTFDDYRFDRTKSCDGSPFIQTVDNNGVYRLDGAFTQGFGAEHVLAQICVEGEAALNACSAKIDLELKPEHGEVNYTSVIGGRGLRPPPEELLELTLHSSSPTSAQLFVLLDLSSQPATVTLDTPDMVVTLTSIGGNLLSVRGTVSWLRVGSSGNLRIESLDAGTLETGANGTIETPEDIPPEEIGNGDAGPLPAVACVP